MKTQSIISQSTELYSSSKVSSSSSVKQNSLKDDFSKVMDNRMKTDDYNDKPDSSLKNNKISDESSVPSEESKAAPIKGDDKSQAGNITEKSSEDNKISEVNRPDDKTTLQSKLEDLSNKIENIVTSALDISKEELDNLLQTLGFNMLDLLNSNNLKQLVLQANGANDITAALTDENLSNMIQGLQQNIGELELSENFQMSDQDLLDLINKNTTKESHTQDEGNIKLLNKAANEAELSVSLQDDNVENNLLGLRKNETVLDDQGKGTSNTSVNQKDILVEVQKVSGDSDASLMDSNTSRDDQTRTGLTNQVEAFVNHLVAAGNESVQNFSGFIENARQMHDITNQIVEQIKVVIKPDHTSMELQLNPDSLGKVSLTVSEKNGVLTAQFTTQNAIAKEAIESQMQVLKENLNNQGLKVESIEVTVADYTFNQNNQSASGEQQQSNPQRHKSFIDDKDIYGKAAEEENLTDSVILQSGSSIDYTA